MLPVLLQIGPIKLFTYGLMAAIGLVTGVTLAARRAEKEGLDGGLIADLGFYVIIAAIAGSRLMYVIVEYPAYIAEPLRIFKLWEGGLVFYGGFIACVPVVWWFIGKHKLPFWKVADVLAPYLALAHAIGRLGCLAAGCCYGKPTGSWINIVFTNPAGLAPLGVPLYPTQLFDSLNEFTIFLILLAIRRHKKFDGQLMAGWITLYSFGRFIVEHFRGDPRGHFLGLSLSTSQGIAIIGFVCGLMLLYRGFRRAK